ncbi:LuxR C-terminal-related transcriptional regulator [Streptomyces sp. 4.24]|uniref:helix-turn-helix transcriptional regulator n=1 Tax=Streptomyces tritrimontium TaxID=3406573 RepID=UPI003BB492FE
MKRAAPKRPQDRDRPRELTPEEMDLYREFAEQGPLQSSQVLTRAEPETAAHALDALVSTGLVQQIGPDCFAATNPTDVSAQLLKEWEERVQGAQLDLLRMRGQLAELAIVHASRHRTLEGPPLELIDSSDELQYILESHSAACTKELLRAQPGGPLPAAGRHRDRDRDLLSRGVLVRALYQHSARFDSPTVRYEAELAALGAEARTVSGGLAGCLVFDRALLVLPLRETAGGALLVRSPDLVAFVAEMFDVLWATGEHIGKPREKAFIQDVADQAKRSILQHLMQGDDDRVTARALGISVRTCQRHVSAIMRQLGATSRFQLGYLAQLHGLLAPEAPESARANISTSMSALEPMRAPTPVRAPMPAPVPAPVPVPVPVPEAPEPPRCTEDSGTWIHLSGNRGTKYSAERIGRLQEAYH